MAGGVGVWGWGQICTDATTVLSVPKGPSALNFLACVFSPRPKAAMPGAPPALWPWASHRCSVAQFLSLKNGVTTAPALRAPAIVT